MSVKVCVHGDAAGGFIVEVHDGDNHRIYSDHEGVEHPMVAAQRSANAFAAEFPGATDMDWDHPVDRDGERIAHPADYITADPEPTGADTTGDPNPPAQQGQSIEQQSAGNGAAGSAGAASGDGSAGAPEDHAGDDTAGNTTESAAGAPVTAAPEAPAANG